MCVPSFSPFSQGGIAPGGFNFDAKLSVSVFTFDLSLHIVISVMLVPKSPLILFCFFTSLDGEKAQTLRICSLLILVEWIPWRVGSEML